MHTSQCMGGLSEHLRQHNPHGGKQMESSWENKPLHSMYHRQTEQVADSKFYQWIENGALKQSTEVLIMAAQQPE